METLGQRIRRLRREMGLTQAELAQGLITGSMVSQIESERAIGSEEVMKVLFERLGVSYEELVSTATVRTDQAQVYRQATEKMKDERWDEAIELLQTLRPPNPSYRPMTVLQDLMECFERVNRYDEFEESVTEYIALCYQQDDIRTVLHAYFRLARVERQRRRYEMTRKYLLTAVNIQRRYPELDMPLSEKIFTYLGRTCLEMQLPNEALMAYEEALRTSADKSRNTGLLHHGIASVYIQLGEVEQALPHIEQAIHVYEQNDDARLADQCRLNVAVIERKMGRHPQAMAYLDSLASTVRFTKDAQMRAACCAEQALNACALGQYSDGIRFGEAALLLQLEPALRKELYMGLLDAAERLEDTNLVNRLFAEALDVSHQLEDEGFRVRLYERRLKCLADGQQTEQAAMVAKHFASDFVGRKDRTFPRE